MLARLTRLALSAVVVAGVWTIARQAQAMPRYSAMTGAPCAMCHVNPTGGGMRNRYGRYFAKELLPWGGNQYGSPAEDAGGAWGFDPQVTRWLSFGADFRFAWLYDRLNLPDGSTLTAQNQFFPMQLDLRVAAELGSYVTLYFDKGLVNSGGFEAFGLFHTGLDSAARSWAFYAKAGHFYPTYGLRFDNHLYYTRERIGFGATTRGDGVELGLISGNHTAAVAYFLNGANPQSVSHGVTFRTDYHLRTKYLRVIPGFSVFFAKNGDAPGSSPALGTAPLADPNFPPGMFSVTPDKVGQELRGAGHLMLGLGRFRYLGEIDVVRQTNRADAANPMMALDDRTAIASYQELGFSIRRGIDVAATYEFIDPDTGIKGLANPAKLQQGPLHRIGVMAHWNPFAGAQMQLHYYYTLGDPNDAEDTRMTVILMLHMFL